MIADLRADSARWRQEQRQTGTRGSHSPVAIDVSGYTGPDPFLEPYVGSSTYHASSASRTSHNRRDADSPSVDGPYGLPASRETRIPVERMQDRMSDRMPDRLPDRMSDRMPDRMQIDPPPQVSRGSFQPDGRAPYPSDGRGFPSDSRGYAPDSRSSYPSDAAMSSGGFNGRPPVSAPFGGQEPRYAPSYPQSNDGAPPGYVRQGNYYVPVSSFESAPSVPSRADNYGPGAFGQPQQGREPRDSRYQQQEYADPRYAYPSPAATVSSVSARDREPISSPAQPRFAIRR